MSQRSLSQIIARAKLLFISSNLLPESSGNGTSLIKAEATKVKKQVIMDCSAPTAEGVFSMEAFKEFLLNNIKVDGYRNNFQGRVQVILNGNLMMIRSTTVVPVYGEHQSRPKKTPKMSFNRSQLKYLTKKFLKRNLLREQYHIVSCGNKADTMCLRAYKRE